MVNNSQAQVKVSVLMPVYNAERYVGLAIESILNQTFRDFEFIIINDGSTDHSAEVIHSFLDPRIIFIENETNRGLVASLNRGLSLMRGEYLARMDGDDISLPQRLAKQVEFLNQHDQVGVVGSAVCIIDHLGRRTRIGMLPQEDSLIRWSMCFNNPMAHGTLMMRSDIVMRSGGYPASAAEDYNLLEQLIWVTAFSNLPDVWLYLRRSGNYISSLTRNEPAVISDSIHISHRRMEKMLGEEIPVSLIEKFWGAPIQKSEDALQMTGLISRLVSACTSDKRLSARDIRDIKNDAARRILKIVARRNINAHHRWQIYQLARSLDPYGLAHIASQRIRRTIRNLSLHFS